MPTYEYRCSSCGESLELVHSIHGGPPETCPSCGAKGTLRKAFAPPAIVFKGSGWAKKERSSRAAASKADGDKAGSGEPGGSKEDRASTERRGDSKATSGAATSGADSGTAKSGTSG